MVIRIEKMRAVRGPEVTSETMAFEITRPAAAPTPWMPLGASAAPIEASTNNSVP